MTTLDRIVRNAAVVTAGDAFAADIGVTRGVITHLAQRLELAAANEIDAAGRGVTRAASMATAISISPAPTVLRRHEAG